MTTEFQWQFDAPTGTYKSHAMSLRLYEEALETVTFMEHVQPVDAFGKGKGESVTLNRVNQLDEPTNGRLNEGQRISEDQFTISTVSITVTEWGRSVPITSLARDLAAWDPFNQVQKALRNQFALTFDTAAAATFQNTKIKYAPTGASSNDIATNGTFGATASVNMSLYHVEQIRDYLFDTLRTPMIGDSYLAIFNTKGLRGIKDDSAWEDWHKYVDPSNKFNSEVGRMEQIRFTETNHTNALGKVGTASVLGEGVVFGEDAVALAEAESPEIRVGIPGDFGRAQAAAWYGILEFGLIWDTGNAGEARIVHVGSA